ncbi:MAG TPA: thiolase domain-containing protein [archaeon]|nr:thiolase domain-containing protein [archaeon]
MRNVAVVGVGQTEFGERWDKSLRDLIVEAGNMALNDAGIDRKGVQSLFIGCMSSGRYTGQEHLGALAADVLNMRVPATRYEGACASGSLAFRNAYIDVASGRHDCAIVLGVEKMTDVKGSEAITSLAAAGDQEWEASIGLTFAGLYALMARKHMHDFGTTREQMAMVSVNNHKNGVANKCAQFRSTITVDDVLKSSLVADPLRLLDCSPITDGAAALVLMSEQMAKKMAKPVWVLGSGQGSDTLALHDRASYTEMVATRAAAKEGLAEAGLKINDMSMLEVHDCFSINQIIALEDLGLCEKGKGGKFVEAGHIKLEGSMPVNTTGGLKAGGHPVGATGVRQIIDIARQLRGDSCNQLKSPKYGLNLNVGGSGATAVINVFGKEAKK